MRAQWPTFSLLASALTAAVIFTAATRQVYASPASASDALVQRQPAPGASVLSTRVLTRDGHGHHSLHAAPLLELNETEVLMYHSPTPPSYWTIDIDSNDTDVSRYPGLMMLHGLLMSLAFFIVLPMGIALRSVKHAWHSCAVIVFYGLCVFGCAASALYRKLTPNMYEDQIHSRHGYFILFASACLSMLDLVALVCRFITYVRNGDRASFNIKHFWRTVILGREDNPTGSDAEYAGLVIDELEEFEEAELKAADDGTEPLHVRRNQNVTPLQTQGLEGHHVHCNNRHQYSHSATSERTLFDVFSPTKQYSDDTMHDTNGYVISKKSVSLLRRVARGAFGIAERMLVFAGFVQLLSGIVVYTGGCRENYINGCLAHLIKGGIFWCYGLVTFARFLGSFTELGWAWNRVPSGDYPSAEFVESFVIFFYGITNTWMERFGANPGDPFTTKQLQHISIAVMFWFAGLIGMGIESKRVRRWLAASASTNSTTRSQDAVAEPPSYISSFNPFPALVIGVTGVAMSAHAQTYLFQVQIHALWGYFLVAYSVLRCLTYFFVWLGPPRSILPSRPPTEALGSFFLACGGLTFIFSTEEITHAAMRRGRDDVMMFLNLGVALTCFAFCWTFCVVTFKGWLRSRSNPPVSYRSSA